MDITVQRNAFGRQVDSFEVDLDIPELKAATGSEAPYHAVFIRAPLIESVSGAAQAIATLPDGRIVAARQRQTAGNRVPPELTPDTRFHEYFLSLAPVCMNIRPLDLLDLPALYRYRAEALSLDTTRLLTRGNPLGAVGLMSYLNPERHIIRGSRQRRRPDAARQDQPEQRRDVCQTALPGSRRASQPPATARAHRASDRRSRRWGGFHVLAEVDETSEKPFSALRAAGFSVYAWQESGI